MGGAVPIDELNAGGHACLTFSDPEERLDIVATFVRQGLDHDQKVVCFTESLPPGELATELFERGAARPDYLRRGQLVMRGGGESWLARGAVDVAMMVDFVAAQMATARDEGYSGLRVTADMHWATGPAVGRERLVEYETAINNLFVDGQLTAICQYDRESFDPVTLAIVAQSHSHAVAATIYHEDPVLRLCRQHTPPGIRIAGELDYTYLEVFKQALAETARLDRNPYLNLRDLRFIDAASASAIMALAVSLREGRTMTITCRGLVGKTLQMLGLAEISGIRLVVGHGRP